MTSYSSPLSAFLLAYFHSSTTAIPVLNQPAATHSRTITMSSHGTAPLTPQHVIPNQPLKYAEELHKTALALGASGKGLLAADESTGSIKKRLEGVGKDNTEDNRREWRDVLFSAEGPYEDYVSGVITFEETLMKHDSQLAESKYKGKSFVDILKSRGVVPGIKVDKGTVVLPRTSPEETSTQGLDGLLERSQQYYERGARFSKWRATYTVSESTPSPLAMEANAEALARYAAISQQAGLVPIVEPEVLMAGDFTIQRSMEAHIAAYSVLFQKLALHKIDLAGLVLKASMVVCGDKKGKATPEEVGEATIHALSKTVPPLVPTIVFLSGGFSDSDILSYLNSINKVKQANPNRAPWALTFSFGRALQGVAMKSWAKGDVKDAQAKWVDRAKWSSAASVGKYNGECPS